MSMSMSMSIATALVSCQVPLIICTSTPQLRDTTAHDLFAIGRCTPRDGVVFVGQGGELANVQFKQTSTATPLVSFTRDCRSFWYSQEHHLDLPNIRCGILAAVLKITETKASESLEPPKSIIPTKHDVRPGAFAVLTATVTLGDSGGDGNEYRHFLAGGQHKQRVATAVALSTSHFTSSSGDRTEMRRGTCLLLHHPVYDLRC
jgi:hypothetical protein